MEYISSRDNKNVKEFVKLSNSKAQREKEKLFVIESVKLVLEACSSNVEFEKVFVTQYCLDNNTEALQKLFDLEQKGVNFYVITKEIEQKLTQTNNAGGIFALCKKTDRIQVINEVDINGKFIYLARLQDTGNVGTIIRTAEALGVNGIIISKDTCDIYSLKVLRASMGSCFRMKMYLSNDMKEDITKLKEKFSVYASVVDKDAKSVEDVSFSDNSIIVIGNEGNGLDEETVNVCSEKITIKMKGNAESFNAGMAAGLLMWEMLK